MVNTFDWVEIRIKDIAKAADFYKELFGWKIIRKQTVNGRDYWIIDTCDKPRMQNIQRGALHLCSDEESTSVVVYIFVNDIDTTLEKVKELGGKVVTPKTQMNSANYAYFTDPNGIMFGLWEEK